MSGLVRDRFPILAGEATENRKVQRSEFVAIAFPCSDQSLFRERLAEIAREHHSSRHHCWAYRILDPEWSVEDRSSDAGEPSGTAGRPILQAIESADLFNTAVVVVRYFGGVKLGTGGLVRAYSESARAALEQAPIREILRAAQLTIEVPFSLMSEIYRLMDPPELQISDETFGDAAQFTLEVRAGRLDALRKRLHELRAKELSPDGTFADVEIEPEPS